MACFTRMSTSLHELFWESLPSRVVKSSDRALALSTRYSKGNHNILLLSTHLQAARGRSPKRFAEGREWERASAGRGRGPGPSLSPSLPSAAIPRSEGRSSLVGGLCRHNTGDRPLGCLHSNAFPMQNTSVDQFARLKLKKEPVTSSYVASNCI